MPAAPRPEGRAEALAARRRALQQLSEAIDHLPRRGRLRLDLPGEPARLCDRAEARGLLEAWRRDLDRRQLLLETDRRAIDVGTAAHEMVHQLVRNSGLIRRHDDFPVWLHEGLATQFEVVRGGVWAGVGRVHDIRLPDWRAIAPPPPLIPLLRDLGFEHGYRRDLYAQSWALVYFLARSTRGSSRHSSTCSASPPPRPGPTPTAPRPPLRRLWRRPPGPRGLLASSHGAVEDAPGRRMTAALRTCRARAARRRRSQTDGRVG